MLVMERAVSVLVKCGGWSIKGQTFCSRTAAHQCLILGIGTLSPSVPFLVWIRFPASSLGKKSDHPFPLDPYSLVGEVVK